MSDCYKRTVEDAYQKLLDNEGRFSGIADEIKIEGMYIAFYFDGLAYRLPKHSINCNSIYDVYNAVSSKETYYRKMAADKKETAKKKKEATNKVVFDKPINIHLFSFFSSKVMI